MIAFLASAVLAAVIGMFIRAHALTITKQIVKGWVWLYSAIVPKEDRDGRRWEVSSHFHEMTNTLQKAGYAPGEIAIRILEHCAIGMIDDMAWCAPFAPGVLGILADRAVRFSDAIRRFKTPKFVIPTLGTFGLMNWGFFSSSNPQSLTNWLLLNGVGVAVTVLIWKQHRPWARRIFQAWMGIGMLGMVAFIVWMAIRFHLYHLPIFQALMLAMASMTPTILLADKSWRSDFKKHWLTATIGWVLMILLASTGSMVLTGSITPLLTVWEMMAAFVISLFILCAIMTLAASAVWYGGLKGSAAGLRLMAAGMKRLK